jgi:hypothetical protein
MLSGSRIVSENARLRRRNSRLRSPAKNHDIRRTNA